MNEGRLREDAAERCGKRERGAGADAGGREAEKVPEVELRGEGTGREEKGWGGGGGKEKEEIAGGARENGTYPTTQKRKRLGREESRWKEWRRMGTPENDERAGSLREGGILATSNKRRKKETNKQRRNKQKKKREEKCGVCDGATPHARQDPGRCVCGRQHLSA